MYYLYIKTHNITGLKYLGQTKQNPYKYNGSGKYWKRHLKKHGCDITTKVILKTESYDILIKKGLEISKKYNIVDNKEWANLTEESGNGIGSRFSSELQKRRIKEGKFPQKFTSKKQHNTIYQELKTKVILFLVGNMLRKLTKKC